MIDEGLREGFYDNGSHQPPPSMRTVAYSLYALRGEHAAAVTNLLSATELSVASLKTR